jgi:hypothetical protein
MLSLALLFANVLHLLCKGLIGFGGYSVRIERIDAFSLRACFSRPDGQRNFRLKNSQLVAVVPPQDKGNFLCKVGAGLSTIVSSTLNGSLGLICLLTR